jgi:hypothetical protein
VHAERQLRRVACPRGRDLEDRALPLDLKHDTVANVGQAVRDDSRPALGGVELAVAVRAPSVNRVDDANFDPFVHLIHGNDFPRIRAIAGLLAARNTKATRPINAATMSHGRAFVRTRT